MQVQIDIGFEQLISIAKNLPAQQWARLKSEVDQGSKVIPENKDLEAFLLQEPTFSKKQLSSIAATRRAINQWRKNSLGGHMPSH